MNLNIERDWMLRKAEKEENGVVSVGGLVSRLETETEVSILPLTERAALAQLVEWQRRKLRLTVEQLAAHADVEIEDVLALEKGEGAGEPRTIFKLAQILKLPFEKLMQLAGLVSQRSPQLEQAAVRFAARSAPMEALTAEQAEALEEFVKVLDK